MEAVMSKTVINRGVRIYHLKVGSDGKPRTLGPGKSIECLDEAEFKALSGYRDIADADKIMPHNAAKIDALEMQLQKLKDENERLTKAHDEQVSAKKEVEPEPVVEEQKESKPVAKKKKGK
jgi:hypothetical protein